MSTAVRIELQEPAPGPRRFTIPGLRWWVAVMLMVLTVIYYFDRSALGVVGPTLRSELGIDEVSFSYVIIAFQLFYGVFQPMAGRLIDWLNIRVGYSISIVAWSLTQLITGLATGWRSLAMVRAVLGVSESAVFPGAIKTVSQWFPPKERTVATGILNMGSGLGNMIAPLAVTFIVIHYSWRAAFLVSGVLGLAWVAAWVLFYRPPEKHPLLSASELAHIRSGAEAAAPAETVTKVGWKVVARQREFWALAAARFLSEPAWQLFTYWIPFYLVTERHLDIKQVAYFAWVPFLAADVGSLFGGVLSPIFIRRGWSVLAARKMAVTVPAALMTFSILIGRAPSVELAILFFSVGAFAHQAISATLLTLPADLFPKGAVATANGMSGTAGYAGGILFTFIVGRVAKSIGYGPLFAGIAFFDLIGAAVLWMVLRESPSAKSRTA